MDGKETRIEGMITWLAVQRKITDRSELSMSKEGEPLFEFDTWFTVDFCGNLEASDDAGAMRIMNILKRDCYPLSSFRVVRYTSEVIL